MNREKLKKLLYDLNFTTQDLSKSLELIKKYTESPELKLEFANSLKYKYLSLFILYEDFISMLLKENGLFEIGISINDAISKLHSNKFLDENEFLFLNEARLLRNKIGHRYKQPSIEALVNFLDENQTSMKAIENHMKSYL